MGSPSESSVDPKSLSALRKAWGAEKILYGVCLVDGQSAPYCLLRPEWPCRSGPLDVAIDRLEINGKIELHSVAAFHCNRHKSAAPDHTTFLSTLES